MTFCLFFFTFLRSKVCLSVTKIEFRNRLFRQKSVKIGTSINDYILKQIFCDYKDLPALFLIFYHVCKFH